MLNPVVSFKKITACTKKLVSPALGFFLLLGNLQQAVAAESLVIWTHTDLPAKLVQKLGDQFQKDTGVEVVVAYKSNLNEFTQQGASGSRSNNADIIIWPHSSFGSWAEQGLLAPITPSKQTKKQLSDHWRSVSNNNQTYGYPLFLYGTNLLSNNRLIKKPAKSWEDVIKLKPALESMGKTVIAWDYANLYLSYPIFQAEGGYAFAETKQGWDIGDTGINHKGALTGMNLLKTMVQQEVVPKNVGFKESNHLFASAKAAMTITGSWAWDEYDRSGIDFSIVDFPKVKSNYGLPMHTVVAAGINEKSEQKALSQQFVENYLLSRTSFERMAEQNPYVYFIDADFMKEHLKQLKVKNAEMASKLAKASSIWLDGEPVPNLNTSNDLFSRTAVAINAILTDRSTVEDALNGVANYFE